MVSHPMLSSEEELISLSTVVDLDEKYFNLIMNLTNLTNKSYLISISEYNEICTNKKSHINIFS